MTEDKNHHEDVGMLKATVTGLQRQVDRLFKLALVMVATVLEIVFDLAEKVEKLIK